MSSFKYDCIDTVIIIISMLIISILVVFVNERGLVFCS